MKRNRKILISILVVAACSTAFAYAGCSCDQQASVVNQWGRERAFIQGDGKSLHLYNGTAAFYIDESIGDDYFAAAEYAIKKADEASSGLSITISGNKSSSFNIQKTNEKSSNVFAVTTSGYVDGEIIYSTITYYTELMDGLDDNQKIHIAIHEMGHVLGLDDLEEGALRAYSIMYYAYSKNSGYTFDNFQDFDLYNIQWQYDN